MHLLLEYMQENYLKHEKETDEKMLKLKKKCERYQKMLPDNICCDKTMEYGLKERVLKDVNNAKKDGATIVKASIKIITTAMKKAKKKMCKYL